MSKRTDAIVGWLRQRLNQSGARGFVFGLSGGVDSAVVGRLCQAAAPANVVGVLMPCHSDPPDEAGRKAFLLRLSPELHAELRGWANQELRSLNAHIEWLLREAVRKRRGR